MILIWFVNILDNIFLRRHCTATIKSVFLAIVSFILLGNALFPFSIFREYDIANKYSSVRFVSGSQQLRLRVLQSSLKSKSVL